MLAPYEGGRFRITQRFTLGSHDGLDIVGMSSKTLTAVCDATVIQSRIVTNRNDKTWEWGNYVMLQAEDGTRIVYAHMSERLVKTGDKVRTGDPVGVEGNTGFSFGSHCHLEVRNAANKATADVNTPAFTGIPNEIKAVNAYAGNEQKIFDFCINEMGLKTAAACGVLANIERESSFNPNCLGDNGTSYGICQWHNNRWERLKNYCDEHGLGWRSLEGQLRFLKYELEKFYYEVLARLKYADDDADGAYAAGYAWCYWFEIPKDREGSSNTRGKLARDKYYPKYAKEDEPMTKEEKKAFDDLKAEVDTLGERVKELTAKVEEPLALNKVYHWYSQLPKYARPTIEALHRDGVFAGAGPDDMALTEDMMRILYIDAKKGDFGEKYKNL